MCSDRVGAGQEQYKIRSYFDTVTVTMTTQVILLLIFSGALTPIANQGTKTFGCLCCTTGPLNASLSLPKTGYVCGETIFFSAEIENLSDKVMTSSTISLIEHEKYTARSGMPVRRRIKQVPRTVVSHTQPKIEPGETFTWSNVALQIPPLPPSELIYCNIIDVNYRVVLTVDPSGVGFDLDVPVNIIIGTIPLRQQYQHIIAAPNAPIAWTPPEGGGEEAAMPPPPSYNEVVHGKTEIAGDDGDSDGEDGSGDKMFAPHYPTYNFQ